MDLITNPLPPQFLRRAATAKFIVDLEVYFYQHDFAHDVRGHADAKPLFANLPAPPEHLDHEAVEECRAIASMLTLARKNKYQVTWDAESYANNLQSVALPEDDIEDRLMVKYPPLIGVDGVLKFQGNNLPLVLGPAIVTDSKDRVLLWYLPGVLSPRRQSIILSASRCLEAQLTTRPHSPEHPDTKNWRTDDTLFNPGVQWQSGSTLLYPAGFQQGHTAPQFLPAPSADAQSARAHNWMVEFEESGGLLDGILAVAHPALYAAAQELMAKLCTVHAPSTFLMQTWPSSFTSVQVISNRQTPWHRDLSSMPGWLDLLLSLGSYGENAVFEVRTLGISLPYDSGSVVSLSSKVLLHRVPKVPLDRLCYALYLNKAVFESLEIPLPGLASGTRHDQPAERRAVKMPDGGTDSQARGSGGHERGGHLGKKDTDGIAEDHAAGEGNGNDGGEAVGKEDGVPDDGSGGSGDDEDGSSSKAIGRPVGEEEELSDIDMVGDQSAS